MTAQRQTSGGFFRSRTGLIFLLMGGIAAFFLLTEHTAHVFGALPYLFLFSCVFLHLFMHGGHGGGHGGHGGGGGPHAGHGSSQPPEGGQR